MNSYYEYDKDFLKGKTILCPCDDPSWSNFTKFLVLNVHLYGIKKIISTSYALNSKKKKGIDIPILCGKDKVMETLGEVNSSKEDFHGKIFIWDEMEDKPIHSEEEYASYCKWGYLEGDGDFRSEEVKKLRDEADVIITNPPPFSLFREFMKWIQEKRNFSLLKT